MGDRIEKWVLLIFGENLEIAFPRKDMGSRFATAGEQYHVQSGENHLTAFVDRLEDENGRPVGLHVTPLTPEAARLASVVSRHPYARGSAQQLDIWFSEAPLSHARNAGDQAFGGQVFRSEGGTYAMSIDENLLLKSVSEADFLTSGVARLTEIDW